MNRRTVWAIVANGANALIVRNVGKDADWKMDIESYQVDQQNIGQRMSDTAGRSFASVGGSRSGMELHTDPVRNQERLFAEALASRLSGHYDRGEVGGLMLVASPRTLGDLRAVIPDKLVKILIRELDKDLTNLSGQDLMKRLVELRKRR